MVGPHSAPQQNLISQGVTFTFNDLGGNTLQLTIDNILSGPIAPADNWAPVQFLDAFDIRDVGSFSAATATYIAQSENGALGKQVTGSGIGCANGGGASTCFDWTPNLSLTDHMVFDIAFTPSGSGVDLSNPHLKIAFLVNDNDTSKTGDLLSENIRSDVVINNQCTGNCPVPGPLVGAGIPGILAGLVGIIGLRYRRRRRLEA